MPQRDSIFLILGAIAILQGCGSGGDIAALQQQVAALATQVEDTRKDLDVMRQTNQELGNLVTALQTEVSTLKDEQPSALPEAPAFADTPSPEAEAAPVPEAEIPPLVAAESPPLPEAEAPALPETETPPAPEAPLAQEEALPPPKKASTSSTAPAKSAAKVSCAQVWKQLGQGKDAPEIAKSLGTTVDAIQACEQGIGRGGR